DVQRGLAENLEMQTMYDLVGDRIREIFDAQVVDIGIVDTSSGLIHFPYTIEKGVRFHDEPMAVFGFRRIVLETRQPFVVNEDIERAANEVGQPFVISGEMARSCVFVPLIVGDRATGVISLQNIDREHAFSDADVRLLTTLAGSLSVALENARLFEETRQRNAELALINDVQRGLAENLEMQAMYDLVGDRATGVISLQNIDREHAFSDADVRLLTTLAGSLSVALQNARLFEETRQRNAELALINDVQRGLAENLDMQSMYDLVGDRI